MSKPEYAAGLHFVVSTTTKPRDKHDRKSIRSHATKASMPRRQPSQLHSWIVPGRELGPSQRALLVEPPISESSSVPSPRRIGSDFSGLQLPMGIEPSMIQDLMKLINLNKHGVYPYEICLDVHIVERGWFPYMISDECCLHSMMFSVRAFMDGASEGLLSRPACFHYGQTLQILRARLNEYDHTSVISDATIMVVITLASMAELTGNLKAMANHVDGLEKIVALRGGVRALNIHNNLQVKVCRTDLSYALMFGCRPRLFKENISWDCFIANRGLIQCNHQFYDQITRNFIEANVDIRLYNALIDLHTFSCISNLAYQTTRKLSPEVYNEMMISILYRLTHLSFDNDLLQEAIRTGLLAFSSTIFLQRDFMEQPYTNLLNLYTNTLLRLFKYRGVDLPIPIAMWLTALLHVVAHNEYSAEDEQSSWLDKTIQRAGIKSWAEVREMLISIAWVNFVHSSPGKAAFDASQLRLANG